MSIYRIGCVDNNVATDAAFKKAFFAIYHKYLPDEQERFRDDDRKIWRPWKKVEGTPVKKLQLQLKELGFLPNAKGDGIFGYATQAAVRLFQEHVRNQQGKAEIGTPDGVVGPKTQKHIDDFIRAGQRSVWFDGMSAPPTGIYQEWQSILNGVKQHYQSKPSPGVKELNEQEKPSASLPIQQWNFQQQAQLIGIRRNAQNSKADRGNDDLFVFLFGGQVLYFWGSTDPKVRGLRQDEPYLAEGQHLYDYGFHLISNRNKTYRGLRPANEKGVRVFRDHANDNSLSAANLAKGVDKVANNTINIHWSGEGRSNWSAGCQVISGRNYIDQSDNLINCKPYAAVGNADLGRGKTKAAYNVFTDLLLLYGGKDVAQMRYTLLHDDVLRDTHPMAFRYLERQVKRLKTNNG